MTRSEIARANLLKRARLMYPDQPDCLSLYQKAIRAKVSSKSCRQNGAKGYAALVSAGKDEIAGRFAADYRFDHPSDLERIIINHAMLLELPIDRAHREVKLGRFYVDFKYNNIVIEVNDDTWHTNDFHGRDAVTHDQGKYVYLRKQGYTVIILAEQTVRTGQAWTILNDLYNNLQEDF